MIDINVIGQRVTRKSADIVAESVRYLKVRFAFSEDWSDYSKTAIFKDRYGKVYRILLNEKSSYCAEDDTFFVPFEVINAPYFKVAVLGEFGDSRITTDEVVVKVIKSGVEEGDIPSEPTADIYAQIVNLSENAVETANSVRADADNGIFKGEKGDKGDKGEKGDKGDKGEKGKPGEASPEFIVMVEETEENADKTQQAYSDFLNQLGSDVATLVGGKIPMSQIPATATQEIYTVTSEDKLSSLTAQKGDLAELIEEINGEKTITKTWQCLGNSTIRENWVVWGTSYAVSAGNAQVATNAENANTINGHRLIEISAEDFETAVKDDETYYLVY